MRLLITIVTPFILIFIITIDTLGQCSDTGTFQMADQLSRELQTSLNSPSKQKDKCHYFINLPNNHSFELINSKVNTLVDRYSDVSLKMNWVKKRNEKGTVYSSALKIGDEWAAVNYFVGDDLVGLTYFIQTNVENNKKITTINYANEKYIQFTLENLILLLGLSGTSLESSMLHLGLKGRNFKGNVSYKAIKTFENTKISVILLNQGNRKILVYQSNTGNFPSGLKNSFNQLKTSIKDDFIGVASSGDNIYSILVGDQNYVIGLNKKEGQISAAIKKQ